MQRRKIQIFQGHCNCCNRNLQVWVSQRKINHFRPFNLLQSHLWLDKDCQKRSKKKEQETIKLHQKRRQSSHLLQSTSRKFTFSTITSSFQVGSLIWSYRPVRLVKTNTPSHRLLKLDKYNRSYSTHRVFWQQQQQPEKLKVFSEFITSPISTRFSI